MSYINLYNTNQTLNVICKSENVQFYSTFRVLTMNLDGDTIEIKVNNDIIDDETINDTKIIGLHSRMLDLDMLKTFFDSPLTETSKLKLTSFTNNSNTKGVLVSDESNVVKYILLDSSYISSLDYSKLINVPQFSNAKISTLTVDANLNMGNYNVQMNNEASSNNVLVPYKQVYQVVKYLQPGDKFDTKVSTLQLNQKLLCSPYDDLGTAYSFQNTTYTITTPNITITGLHKTNISQHVIIGSSSNTLTVGNNSSCYGVSFSDVWFKCNIISDVFLNQIYDTCQFDESVIINSCNAPYIQNNVLRGVYLMFVNCTFNKTITINNGFNGAILTISGVPTLVPSYIFFINCSFSGTITNNSGSYAVVLCESASKLPTYTIDRFNFVGICKTNNDSRLYLNTKLPYDSLTNTVYKWQTTDIVSLNLSQVTVNSALNMLNYAITTTKTTFNNNELTTKQYNDGLYLPKNVNVSLGAYSMSTSLTTFNNNEYITKSYADTTYSASILNSANTFTNKNFFNLPNDTNQNFFIDLTSSGLTDTKYIEIKNKRLYLNSYSGSLSNYGQPSLNDVYLNYKSISNTFIGGTGSIELNSGSLSIVSRTTNARTFFNDFGADCFLVNDKQNNIFTIQNLYTDTVTTPSGIRYTTAQFNDGFSLDLLRLQNSTTRTGCFFATSVNTNLGTTTGNNVRIGKQGGDSTSAFETYIPSRICCDVSGDIRIGCNVSTSNSRAIDDTIRIGGAVTGATAQGDSTIYLGFDASATATSSMVANRDIIYGCSRTDNHTFRSYQGLYDFARRQFTSGNWSQLNAVNGTLNAQSSLSYKENIINKTQEYILNKNEPFKNYYNKIINCPIYTYTYKDSTEKEIHQGPSFEYLHENFAPHSLTIQPTLTEPEKKSLEWYEQNNKPKSIRKGALLDYVILALQEQDKFIIKPLQQKCNDLETKYNDLETKYNLLISTLKTLGVLNNNY